MLFFIKKYRKYFTKKRGFDTSRFGQKNEVHDSVLKPLHHYRILFTDAVNLSSTGNKY